MPGNPIPRAIPLTPKKQGLSEGRGRVKRGNRVKKGPEKISTLREIKNTFGEGGLWLTLQFLPKYFLFSIWEIWIALKFDKYEMYVPKGCNESREKRAEYGDKY